MSSALNANRPDLLRRINLFWYAVLALPIGALVWFSLTGVLPPLLLLPGLFFALFWVISLLFALVALIRRRGRDA